MVPSLRRSTEWRRQDGRISFTTNREVTMESFAPLDSCPDANRMIARLLTSLEEDRACLSRELHDEMGGLLGSVIMDIDYAEQHIPLDVRLRQRLTRAR